MKKMKEYKRSWRDKVDEVEETAFLVAAFAVVSLFSTLFYEPIKALFARHTQRYKVLIKLSSLEDICTEMLRAGDFDIKFNKDQTVSEELKEYEMREFVSAISYDVSAGRLSRQSVPPVYLTAAPRPLFWVYLNGAQTESYQNGFRVAFYLTLLIGTAVWAVGALFR